MATRDEHLAWARQRALRYLEAGNVDEAFASLGSDLAQHPVLRNDPQIRLGARLLIEGHLETPAAMRSYIEGFE